MSVLKVAQGQAVTIPDLLFEDGRVFAGTVGSNDGERLVIDHDPEVRPRIDGQTPDRVYTLTWEVGDQSRSCPLLIRSRSGGKLVCKVVIEERRESLRVRCAVQMSYSKIDPASLNHVAEQLLACVTPSDAPEAGLEVKRMLRARQHEDESQSELAAIRRLMEKLVAQVDRLTRIAEGQRSLPEQADARALEVLDCSASGVAFRGRAALPAGTFLKIRLEFDSVPRTQIEAVGVIVRCEPRSASATFSDQFDIGVRFTHIHESDRERIVRHLFRVQRDQIRDRRRNAA